MFNQLTTTEKLAVVASSGVLGALALLACLNLKIAPSYADFIVGNVAWSAGTKMQDLIAAPVFIAVIFLSFVSLSFLLVKQKQLFGDEYSTELLNQLMWWSLPAIAAISGLISSLVVGTIFDTKLFLVSAAGIGFIVAATVYNTVKKSILVPRYLACARLQFF